MKRGLSMPICLLLCAALALSCFAAAETSGAVKTLQDLGFKIDTALLSELVGEYGMTVDLLTADDVLLLLGLGKFDYDSFEWTPLSDQVYAFDAEIFDVNHMYTLFLQGVDAVVPDVVIGDIREDLSQMTDELTESEDYRTPPTDGRRSVSFTCNGHPYFIELDSYGDWFNEEMILFMDEVLEEENCPLQLYEYQVYWQFVIVVYTARETAEKLKEHLTIY